MWHPLLSTFCVAITLCLQKAASNTGTGGLALAPCLRPHLTEGKMAGRPTLSHAHAPSSALSLQWCRAKAPLAQRGGHKITINSSGFGLTPPGNGEITGGPTIMEVEMRFQRKTYWAEQETTILLKCCFWNNIVWSFRHRTWRCLTNDLDLLYYGLILPVCVVTILATIIIGIQLLAGCMRSYQSWRKSKNQWAESLPSMVWGHSECAICLQAYKPGEMLKLLSCSHAFHGKCIDHWHCVQLRSKTCPLCMRSVTTVVLIPHGAHNRKQD